MEEQVKAPEGEEEEKGGICGPTVVVLLAMVVLFIQAHENIFLKGLLGFNIRRVVCTPPGTFSTSRTFERCG
jgi:hypothetical protein